MSKDDTQSVVESFHLVSGLIPANQQLATVPHDMAASDAIDYMQRHGFSQVPVMNWTEVVGVFSFRSFTKAILDMEDLGDDIGDMPVIEFVEEWKFAFPDDSWESILKRLDRDNGVLVGNRRDLAGIVTTMDMVNYLHQLAQSFVIVREIELSLRKVILACVSEDQLQICIENSLSQLRGDKSPSLPSQVTEMTFNHYVQVIGDGRNWNYFQPFFGTGKGQRKRTRSTLQQIGELRNEIFHFKRTIEIEDIKFLVTKRDWLQRKARVFDSNRFEDR